MKNVVLAAGVALALSFGGTAQAYADGPDVVFPPRPPGPLLGQLVSQLAQLHPPSPCHSAVVGALALVSQLTHLHPPSPCRGPVVGAPSGSNSLDQR